MGRIQTNDGGSKKKVRQTTRESTGSAFMLRCAQLGLSDDALNNMDLGMVYDMLIEEDNDKYEYPYKATQADIERYFGKG